MLPVELEKLLRDRKPDVTARAEELRVAPAPAPKPLPETRIESAALKPALPSATKPERLPPETTSPVRPQPLSPKGVLPQSKPVSPPPQNQISVASAPMQSGGVREKMASPSPRKPVAPPAQSARSQVVGSTIKPVDKPVATIRPASPPKESQAELSSKVVESRLVPSQQVEIIAPAAPEAAPPPARAAVPPMYIVMITPELAPVAKVGGLGDVVYGLARELELRGNSVEIILPKYNHMRYDHIWGLTKVYEDLWVPWYGGAIHTSVWFGFVHGRKCFFIEPHSPDNFFNRGAYYGQRDDVMRYAFFCRAALEFMLKTNKHPEVIHCHDWQTALVPVLLYEMYQPLGLRHSRVCFTIHNFRHQGVTGGQVLQATGLNRPEYFFHYDRLRDNKNAGALNLMKAGIVYSNFTTTVSPRHAWEAKDAGQGDGLEPTLHTHHSKFGGVLNGVDYDQFNPETDPYIPVHFNAQTIEKKYENKQALRHRFWLADNEKPLLAFIGRLDQQKGLEQVRHAIAYALNHRAQFVLLGSSPERAINDHFLGLKHQLNNHPDCHLEIGYHEELAHLIYAGADMLVVPSRYEPCGLTQLIALRYGTVPIVRAVGGLADTVFDKDHSSRPLAERNGYVFEHADNPGIESALHRALGCYYEFPNHWRDLMLNGMRSDYSWNHPGQHYLNIYDYIRDK